MTIDAASAQPSFSAIRKWRRHSFQIDVSVTTQVPARPITCMGRGCELNGGGLAVEAEIDLAVAQQVTVRFTPPGTEEAVTFRCFVRNRTGNRYGLEFIAENDVDYLNTGRLQEKLAESAATKTS